MDNAAIEFLSLLKNRSSQQIRDAFVQLDDSAKKHVLEWLFKQSSNPEVYSDMQGLSVLLIDGDSIPTGFMSSLVEEDRFAFFYLALQSKQLLQMQNHQGNTLLHLMFANPKKTTPPFNFIRSLLLFERNEDIAKCLTVRNQQGLTPIETYLAHHASLAPIATPEMGALIGLMEAEKSQRASVDLNNLGLILKHLCHVHGKTTLLNAKHRLILLGAYFNYSESDIEKRIHAALF
ncbi:hypothetical protein [Pseudoalteromonas xiamenensis]